jgi:hypothetical protein
MRKIIALVVMPFSTLTVAEPPPVGERISFVSCPAVRDTRSVPCWTSDYGGDTYYLTIQSDVSAAVQPPLLGHQVLVEGIVTGNPAICGGIVLEDVHLTAMPELDANCNAMLPAVDEITIDFNPRPPGPSGGRLAFQRDPSTEPPPPPPPTAPQVFELYFDFDKGISFRHPGILVGILDVADKLEPSRMQLLGVRGAHLLSDGTLLQESENTGRRRAEEVAGLLHEAGISVPADVAWTDAIDDADGVDDWKSRRVTIILQP